jgi:repressor LexA
MSITDRQEELLRFIAEFKKRRLSSPSLEEMCKALGVSSRGSLVKHVRALEEQGYLVVATGKKRDWNLTPKAWNLVGRTASPSIPLVGHIAAGTPILAEENREDEIPVDPALFGSGEAFALRVRGDSMIEAHIQNGDLAIIRPQGEALNGQIVAVAVDGLEVEATLKVFRTRRGGVELHPANSRYEPLVFKGEELSRVRVLGKLIGIIRPTP